MFNREEIFDKNLYEYEFGMVLAGGGGKGAYQAGVYKALSECGLVDNIKYMSGSSVGALNMCMFAQKDRELPEKVWKSISQNKITKVDFDYIDMKEGLFGREGLIKIMNDNIDFNDISNHQGELYATISEYDENGNGEPKCVYEKLNGKTKEEIKQVLLASSSIPAIFEPVKIGDKIYRDGGLTDNLPAMPLYNQGVRKFIVIALSVNKKIDYGKYPEAEFILIKPSRDLGDAISGTMDFSKRGAKMRFKMGYEDAKRTLKYYNSPESKEPGFAEMIYRQEQIMYDSIMLERKTDDTEYMISKDMNKINKFMDKYGL